MKLSIANFYPASTSNYNAGRSGRTLKYFTVHHSAGWENTLRYLWANPARGGSSHFWVGNVAGQIEQYVDTDDTAWCNGNWISNCESISCETRGDWRNGYYDGNTLKNLEDLMYACLKIWPHLQLTFHQDVSDKSTECPADLKHKGYALGAWNRAKARLATSAPVTPPASKISYKPITPKRIQTTKVALLWDFNFTDWAMAKSVKTFGANELIDVVAVAENALGGKYYMTAYSYNGGAIRQTYGINVVDVKDYVAPTPVQPTPTPVWVPMDTPRTLVTARDLKVVDLDTLKEVGDVIPKGTDISFTTKKTLSNNVLYVRSKWATDNNKNWGVPYDSLVEKPTAPVKPPVEVIPPTPIDTNPNTVGNGDVEKRLSALEKIVKSIVDFLTSVFKNFKV